MFRSQLRHGRSGADQFLGLQPQPKTTWHRGHKMCLLLIACGKIGVLTGRDSQWHTTRVSATEYVRSIVAVQILKVVLISLSLVDLTQIFGRC